MKNSKYLFSWHGRFQISTINLRTSLFQVEGSDVGQNLQINLCNLLFLVFLCNFRYFRFRAIISLFLGAFDDFQVKFGFCYGQVSIMSYFRIFFFFSVKFYRALKQTVKSIHVFLTIIQLIKFRLSSFYFLVDLRPFLLMDSRNPRGFEEPSWIRGTLVDSRIFSKANVFCFLFSKSKRVLLLVASASHITKVKNFVTTIKIELHEQNQASATRPTTALLMIYAVQQSKIEGLQTKQHPPNNSKSQTKDKQKMLLLHQKLKEPFC